MRLKILTNTGAALALGFAVTSTVYGASLGNSVGVYVFPADGQSEDQQLQDDAACFGWAKEQTNYDPVNPTVVTAQPQDTGPTGSRLRGAARGAVGGAIIGEIANDDAGDGAAIGATLGALRGGSQERRQRSEAQQQASQGAQQATNEMREGFKRAYGACMEGKGYSSS